MPDHAQNIFINVDASPMRSFLHLFKCALNLSDRSFERSELPPDLGRIESDHGAAGTGELRIVFYPSDAFLRCAAAVFTGELDFRGIK